MRILQTTNLLASAAQRSVVLTDACARSGSLSGQDLRPQMPRPLRQHHHGWRGDFSFKFTDPATGKQRTGWLGVYNPETFAVEDARSRVYGLRGTGAAALAETFRDAKAREGKTGQDRR